MRQKAQNQINQRLAAQFQPIAILNRGEQSRFGLDEPALSRKDGVQSGSWRRDYAVRMCAQFQVSLAAKHHLDAMSKPPTDLAKAITVLRHLRVGHQRFDWTINQKIILNTVALSKNDILEPRRHPKKQPAVAI